jgi:hemerythrin-like domain-containing protein
MNALIFRLKKEHSTLLRALEDVRNVGIVTPEGRAGLLAIKNALLEHLGLEDAELYPVLRVAAQSDRRLSRTLDVFARDLEHVTDIALLFFQRYEKAADDIRHAMDFGKLVGVLKLRIQKEESVLYPAYEQVLSESA